MTLRERLWALMCQNQWSQGELARQLGVYPMLANRLLHNESPRQEKIHRVVVRLAELERNTQDSPEAAVTAPGQ